jgi:hypothetical protein
MELDLGDKISNDLHLTKKAAAETLREVRHFNSEFVYF